MPRAREAALNALKLDESLVESSYRPGMDQLTLRLELARSGEGVQARQRSALNPNYATAHHWYAIGLVSQDRFDEAFVEIKEAERLDRLSLNISTAVGTCFYFARQHDRTIEQYRKTVEMNPEFSLAHEHLMVRVRGKRHV